MVRSRLAPVWRSLKRDVEARRCRAGNHVRCRVAHIDRGELKPARLKVLGPLVEREREQGIQQRHEARQRVLRQHGVGDVPLPAFDPERAVEAAAPADLHHLAELFRVGGLAHQAGIERLVTLGEPVEHLARAVDRRPLLVAGDQQADGARTGGGRHRVAPRRRRRRRSRPSCRSLRARRGRRPPPPQQRVRESSFPARPLAPRRYGRRSRSWAGPRPAGRRGCRPARFPAPGRVADGR